MFFCATDESPYLAAFLERPVRHCSVAYSPANNAVIFWISTIS